MIDNVMDKSIVYIGDFDFHNENVQSHLVKNNARILNLIGFDVFFIGINKYNVNFKTILKSSLANNYLELPNTLNFKGLFHCSKICKRIILQLNEINNKKRITHVITYQSPTFAKALKKIAIWCKKNSIKYIVNCADIPIFNAQPIFKRIVMNINWKNIHRINNMFADGVIGVSDYICNFYKKNGRQLLVIPPLFDKEKYNFDRTQRGDVVSFIYAGTPFVKTNSMVKTTGMKDRLDLIIDLFLALGNNGIKYRFIIIGIEKQDYLKGVPRHRTVLEGNRCIEFLGKCNHITTLKYINECDFSINYRDINKMTMAGFSTKIVESISLGTPVITNETSDIKKYLAKNIEWFELQKDFDSNLKLLFLLSRLSKKERDDLRTKVLSNQSFDVHKYIDQLRSLFVF